VRSFIKDESGVTMGLAVIMIVLIGVMGAGLLTFATRHLESVVEVNRGQLALKAADAGLEATRRHLATGDARPSSYDAVVTTDNSEWYDDGSGTSGKTMTFEGNQTRVGIRYLTPSTNESEARQPNNAPEVLPNYGADICNDANGDGADDDIDPTATPANVDACAYPNSRHYFRVTVWGGAGNATRVIQAIYRTENFEIPVGYYATRNIDFNGNATDVDGLSLFANGNITNLRAENLTGLDQAYGDWATVPTTGLPNAYNRTPRTAKTAAEDPAAAGAAALGTITYDPTSENNAQKGNRGNPQRYGYRDYDANSASISGRPNFVGATAYTGPPNQITFPFETGNTTADAEMLAALKAKAQDQGLYTRRAPGSSFTIDQGGALPDYPASSDLTETVMFIEFANGTDDSPVYGAKGHVTYKSRSSDADNLVKGTIVVVNGDLDTSSSSDAFQGAMIVRDPNDADNGGDTTSITCNDSSSTVMDFCNSGSVNIEGFVNVEGDMRLGGNVGGFLPSELVNGLPGLFRVSLWSWRECYTATCS
jgi:hypothetical protein